MANIHIDTSNLTYTQFVIPDVISQPIEGANAPTISLDPGSYGFQQVSGAVANFRFQVTPEGLIDYDVTYDGFLSGRGSNTLTIRGFTITLDATALSHDLLLSSLLWRDNNLLTRDRTHELTLVPLDGYNFSSASGVNADFRFDVGLTGEVVINTQLYGGFARVSERSLIISGYQITIDAQRLFHDLVADVLSREIVPLQRDRTHDLTYIPATGYGFLVAAGIVADFRFAVTVTGEVSINTQLYSGFASAEGRLLIIRGYQITIDARQLSQNLTPSVNSVVDIPLQRDRTHELTYIPAMGHGFRSGQAIEADFKFALDVTGQVVIDTQLYGGFASASGRSLTIRGYQVTIDGRRLSYDLLLSLLGNTVTLTRDRTHQVTFIPAVDYYRFQATNEILADFQFNVTKDGRVVVASGFSDFARTEGLTLILGTNIELTDPAPIACSERIVAGQVMQSSQTPFRGSVILFYQSNAGSLRLGESAADPEGRYTIAYTLSANTTSANLRVAAFDASGRRRAEAIIEATKPVEVVNLTVSDESKVFRIVGKVTSSTGVAGAELQVVIVDKNVGSDETITETTTDTNGDYQVTFTYTGQKQKLDLQARVLREAVFLGASEVRYNAANDETLNVVVETVAAQATEYETLIDAIRLYFSGDLRDLQETSDRQDITYLANKTGRDTQSISMASFADRFSSKAVDASGTVVIKSDFFYALFRAGYPNNEVALYQTSVETVRAVWREAIENQIIPAVSDEIISQALEQYQRLAVESTLNGAPPSNGETPVPSLATDLLSLSLNEAQQRKFAELKVQYGSNLPIFWEQVRLEFGEQLEKRLQLDGQLAALTINNVPLIRKLHAQAGEAGLSTIMSLVNQGFSQAAKWQEVIGTDTPIPPEIVGESDPEKRNNYANFLATQIRLGYPTAVIAQMVDAEQIALTSPAVPKQSVVAFLQEHQGTLNLGAQPIEKYLSTYNVSITPELKPVVKEVERIQRVYQITPSDEAMYALLKRPGLDSAYAVVHYGREAFIQTFKDEMGGETNARLTYAKAEQVHNTVLNLAMSYQVARTAPTLGSDISGQVLNPRPNTPMATAANAGDVIAYPTLEGLFGELDYCACEHCRSFLSPAAYLVDLLMFIDPSDWQSKLSDWKRNHKGVPYPFINQDYWQNYRNTWARNKYSVRGWDNLTPEQQQQLPNTEITPLEVLLSRRPDIQHLRLTCENTNGLVPHIDLVNETLEYYITNGLSLADTNPDPDNNTEYKGHSTEGDATPEELLASPQFVSATAYETLSRTTFPLPFHQPLENLRRYFDRFEAPLPKVMEALRKKVDELDRSNENEYAWSDILLEELQFSRPEYNLLTNSTPSLQTLFGYPPGTSDDDVRRQLSKAKDFTRRMGITYEEIVSILQTHFINPGFALIPKLERLRISFATFKTLHESEETGQNWLNLLPNPVLDASKYDGNIEAWVKNEANFNQIARIITLYDPTGKEDSCTFDTLEFRYTDPDLLTTLIEPIEFVKLIRFIRLWKKLGWTIEQTDKTITALYPANQSLDDEFKSLLIRIGVLKQVMESLALNPDRDLLPLLTCFAPIDTHGAVSLYRQMFLSSTILKQNRFFADDGYGNFLQTAEVLYNHPQPTLDQSILNAAANQIAYDASEKRLLYSGILSATTRDALKQVPGVSTSFQAAIEQLYNSQRLFPNTEILRAAFQLTADEFSAIANSLGFNAETPLTLENISSIFRRGWLSHKLKLSVREFLLLTQVTGINPFSAPDAPNPPILELIKFSDRLRAVSLPTEQALYLIWNQDISGKSVPTENSILQFARTLRADFATIASEVTQVDDPESQIARDQMGLAYGSQTTDFFFSLLNQTLVTVVEEYNHPQDELEPAILNAGSERISYDNLRKQLSFKGVLSEAIRDALEDASAVPAFKQAVNALFEKNRNEFESFFERHPELRSLYDIYVSSNDPLDKKRSHLLASFLFLPELHQRRKRQQALQAIGAVANVDSEFAGALLNNQFEVNLGTENEIKNYILHAADPTQPALNDLIAQEEMGLSVQFFFRDEAIGNSNLSRDAEANLNYVAIGDNPLPANPSPDNPISGIWSGYLEAPENGFYTFRVEADAGAEIELKLAGTSLLSKQNDTRWSNSTSIELQAGTLYNFELKAEKIKNTLNVRWQVTKPGWEVIPSRYLYSQTLIDRLPTVYIRFLKCVSLAVALKLTANELAYFAKYPNNTQSWLNQLSTIGDPDAQTSIVLLKALTGLTEFTRLKAELTPGSEQLLNILKDPETSIANNSLFQLTRWESSSLNSLLAHFEKEGIAGFVQLDITDLAQIETFSRVHDAFGWVKKLGISIDALIAATTNEPKAETVSNLQSALRARYDEESWFSVLKPINDEMRGLQRNALVTYVLHYLQADPETAHINTADKLFEYFLMDVQMEPCMKTSRIRHALSSVQLFIERSLMNLEPRVAPSVIDSQQWQWKKRYRVWEANRKVFLYPENWLEPELRDDQSPFFKETMSELLQSDITEDRAATALINYLSKLDEVAKLEPCGIHVVENDPEKNTDDIVHVVARTVGANRKYYYRRQESGVSWTPWEQIKLDIEDNPVTPFVWKGRTFLFWLRILKQPIQNEKKPINDDTGQKFLASLTTNEINLDSSPVMVVQVVLCWSEYYNGKWQPTKTSDINNPASLGTYKFNEFERSRLFLGIYQEPDKLKIWVLHSIKHTNENDRSRGVFFYLRNTHSLPLASETQINIASSLQSEYRDHSSPSRGLISWFDNRSNLSYYLTNNALSLSTLQVLKNRFFNHRVIEPQHLLDNSIEAPFFYEDNNHVFYVTPQQSEATRKLKTIIANENVFYGILDSGKMLWFKDKRRNGTNAPDGSTGWHSRSGARISYGWQDFKFIFSGGDGIIYAVKPTGELLFYKDRFYQNGDRESTNRPVDIRSFETNPPDEDTGWDRNSGKQIGQVGQSWQDFKFIFSGGDGIIYAVKPTGELIFHKDISRDGNINWHENSGRQIGYGAAQNFNFWIAGGDGIIYGVQSTGELRFYKDLLRNGTNAADGSSGWHINSGRQVGYGWQNFKFLLSGGEGIIYAVKHTGEVSFYRDTKVDGSNSSDGSIGWEPNGNQINTNWT